MKKVKQIFNLLTTAIIAITLTTSCGGGKKEYSVKPSSTAVKGDLSNFFEVVDGSYKLEKGAEKYDEFKIKVQLKRNNEALDFDPKKLGMYSSDVRVYLYCDLLEDNGTPVVVGKTLDGSISEPKELMNLKSGETGWAEFSFSSMHKPDEFEKVKSFGINSEVKKPDETTSSSSSSSNDNESKSSSTASSVDCDQFIKDYTAFVNSYVKLLKKYKANPTDATILNEYTEAAQKAIEMQTNAGDCTDAKYVSKLLELNNKLAQAAL